MAGEIELKKITSDTNLTSTTSSSNGSPSVSGSIHTGEKISPDDSNVNIHTGEKEKVSKAQISPKSSTEKTKSSSKTTNPIFNNNTTNFSTSFELKEIYEKIKITDSTSSDIKKLLRDGKISKQDVINSFRKLEQLSAKYNIDLEKIPKEAWQSFIVLNLKHQAGEITDEQYAKFKETHSSEFIANAIEKYLAENKNTMSQEQVDKYQELYAKLSSISVISATENIKEATPEKTKSRREKFLLAITKARASGHTERLKRLTKIIHKDIDEKTANAILNSANKFVLTEHNIISDYVEKNNYSDDFVTNIKELGVTIFHNAIEKTIKSIQEFWKSPKGQAIKEKIVHQIDEYKKAQIEAKKHEGKRLEIKANLYKIKERIDLAKKKAKIAMGKASEFLKKAGITPSKLTKTEGKNLITKYSPKIAAEFKQAYYQKEEAEKQGRLGWIEYTCALEREQWAMKQTHMNEMLARTTFEAAMIVASSNA